MFTFANYVEATVSKTQEKLDAKYHQAARKSVIHQILGIKEEEDEDDQKPVNLKGFADPATAPNARQPKRRIVDAP